MKKTVLLLSFFLSFALFFIASKPIYSEDQYDVLGKQIAELQRSLEMSINATTPLETRVKNLRGQLGSIEQRVSNIEADLAQKKRNINSQYSNLAKKQELFNKTVKAFYIKSYLFSPLLLFISEDNTNNIARILVYQKRSAQQDKALITNMAITITDLEEKKIELEKEEKKLSQIKISLASEKLELEKIVKGAKEYQSTLSNQIAQLSARQQEILAARSGSFTVSIGDSELADDYNASIKGFREAAPAGSFAIFSFGAHTHRKGMSQYGARGRAQSGQNYKDILKAYYGREPTTKDTGGSISVSGYGGLDFETTYLYGIAEMPSSWNKEALKAQAVAARSYAFPYKQNGRTICTDEGCQVFSMSKSNNVPPEWKQAVDQTRGEVIEGITTFYSSTTGGYVNPLGWDTTDNGGGSGFFDKSYEKIAGSPWFYKAWYTKGYYTDSGKCGRSNPWLSEDDIADIINANYVIHGSGSGADTGRVTPITTSCWGGNPYSHDELRSVSESYGGGVRNISSLSVLQGSGVTNEVVFQTDKGEKRISGNNFKEAFNLRAPGYMSIPQSGFAFFNIEKK